MADLDSGLIPAVCYSTCNSAFNDAQILGKSPELCDSTSSFTHDLNNCYACIDANAGSNKITDLSYLDTQFEQFLSYCNATGATSPTSSGNPDIPASYLSIYGTLVKTLMSITQGDTVITPPLYVSTTTTSTLPAYFTHLSIEALISSYIPADVFSNLAASVSVLAPAASFTGDPSSLIYSALEDGSPPAWFTSAIPATYTAQISTLEASIEALRVSTSSFNSTATKQSTGASTSPSSGTSVPTSTSSQPTSKTWIAGAVVGAIAGILLFVTGVLLFWRRRRRRRRDLNEKPGPMNSGGETTWGKAQLHGDSLAAPGRLYELDGEHHSRELPVIEHPLELSAAEIPHELPNHAREIAAERNH